MGHSTYIFDFDGTLVDSMPYWSQKMLNILIDAGVDYPPDIIKTITPLGDLGTAEYFRDVLGVNMTAEEMIEKMDAYAIEKYKKDVELKAGVAEYLELLHRNGYSLNVLTASPHKMVDMCLNRLGVFDIFDNVWSCDDFKTTKSDPGIYKEAVRRIGGDIGDTVFFDDNIGAIKTAAAAGLFTVGVYDRSATDFEHQIRESADIYIESFVGFCLI